MGQVRLKRRVREGAPSERQLALDALRLAPPARALPVLDVRERGTSFRELNVRTALNSAAATHMGFWSINPYVGCEFGCSYCYARDTHRYTVERHAASSPLDEESGMLDMPAVEAFERHILVKQNLPEVLLRTLDPARIGEAAIVIGTATDPYQPAERRFAVTRSVLLTLLKFKNLHLGIISKSPLITRDLAILRDLAARHRLRVHVSLATDNGALLRRLEPRTPMPHARLRAMGQLAAAGINTTLLIAPIIPLLTDSRADLARLFEAAKNGGASRVGSGPLRLGPTARKRFLEQIRKEFPELLARYERHFARSSNAEPAYRAALSRRIRSLQEEYGFPMDRNAAGQLMTNETTAGEIETDQFIML